MAGETTTDLVANSILLTSKSVGQVVAQSHSVEVRTTDLATNDITGICKLPKGATLLAIIFRTDDLDTDNSVALVWSVLVGSTVFAAGIANDTAKVSTLVIGTSAGNITVTADTIISLKATTAAATAAAGTVDMTLIYTTSE